MLVIVKALIWDSGTDSWFPIKSAPFTWQSRDALKKFMESLIGKTGKLRSLIRELETKYDDTAATS